MKVKTEKEIEMLREGGKILFAVLNEVAKRASPGVRAEELNDLSIKLIKEKGGTPSFLGYKPSGNGQPYPSALCVSINNEVVHGLSRSYGGGAKIFKEGDIVGLDLGVKYKNFYTDMALTVGIGKIDERAESLIKTAKQALEEGIKVVKNGAHLGDIGEAVQTCVEKEGFSVVRKLVGHGVGYSVHERPEIPNWGKKGQGLVLEEGMVLALEPMINEGTFDVVLSSDNWTWKTADGSRSAHFEHTILVTNSGAEILTSLGGETSK